MNPTLSITLSVAIALIGGIVRLCIVKGVRMRGAQLASLKARHRALIKAGKFDEAESLSQEINAVARDLNQAVSDLRTAHDAYSDLSTHPLVQSGPRVSSECMRCQHQFQTFASERGRTIQCPACRKATKIAKDAPLVSPSAPPATALSE